MSTAHHLPEGFGISFPAPVCHDKERLLGEFLSAIQELLAVQQGQLKAVVSGDSDFGRFDVLVHLATRKKQSAKYAYLSHVEAHGCDTQPEPEVDFV